MTEINDIHFSKLTLDDDIIFQLYDSVNNVNETVVTSVS